MNAESLHQRALEVIRNYKKCEIELIEILEQFDCTKSFYALGFASLFEYATRGPGLSEDVACRHIAIARKCREVPMLKEEIGAGTISMTKARKLASILTFANQHKWLEIAKRVSTRELERQIAAEYPENVREVAKYVTSSRLKLELGVSEELMRRLHDIQDILSSKKRRNVTLEEVLDEVTLTYMLSPSAARRIKRALMSNADSQCTHVDAQGNRCPNRRYLETHHIQHRSKGGGDNIENLQLLCYGHHRAIHERPPK